MVTTVDFVSGDIDESALNLWGQVQNSQDDDGEVAVASAMCVCLPAATL